MPSDENPDSEDEPQVFQTKFEDSTSPSFTLIKALAAIKDTEPVELDPLSESVDPDALDTLIGTAEPQEGPLEVAFTIEGYYVRIQSNGRISFRER